MANPMTTAAAYDSVWEHYEDEWARLDIRLAIWMKRMEEPAAAADPALLPFKGLVLTEEEMHRLLAQPEESFTDPEIERLKEQLAELDAEIALRRKAALKNKLFLPVPYIASVFGLNAFEEQTLLMALALETDRKYEKLYAYVQDDATCKYLTPELAIRLFYAAEEGTPGRLLKYFSGGSRLRTWFFRQSEAALEASALLTAPLRLDERMLSFLLGMSYTDTSLRSLMTLYGSEEPLPPLETGEELQEQLRSFMKGGEAGDPTPVFCLWGQSGAGKKLQARHYAHGQDRPLLAANLESMLRDDRPFGELLLKAEREALLYGAVLAYDRFHVLLGDEEAVSKRRQEVLDRVGRWSGPMFLLSEQAWTPQPLSGGKLYLETQLAVPDSTRRLTLWTKWSAEKGMAQAADWRTVAGKFLFSPGQIAGSLEYARHLSRWQTGGAADSAIVHKACYAQVQHNLKRKATRIEPKYDWDQMILPPEQKEQLRHASSRLQHRQKVLGEWGFDRALAYGKGVSLLFAGPPGTGKTMSAQVLAKEVQLEIYKIDLSQVISKYIGETEKNLHEVFTEARLSNAILFFDEADALFGKRSEVKDAHDKYANVETAYLLQKMEEYDGITILATNLLQNLDEAFMRRFGFIVKFPFPDAEHRLRIWRSMIPPEAPLADDVDFRFLAKKFEVAGGLIKNIVVSAAFMAAEQGSEVGMKQLITAARSEMRKNGKILLREELGEYADYID